MIAERSRRAQLRQLHRDCAASAEFLRAQNRRFHHQNFDEDIGQRAHDLLLILQVRRIFLAGRAGAEQAQLFRAGQQRFLGSQRAGSFLARREGPAITSSITLPMAGSSGNRPCIARFSRNPVMMSRLISLVPSKMRLMRESR